MLVAAEICSGCGGSSKWAYCDECLDFMKRVVEAKAAPIVVDVSEPEPTPDKPKKRRTSSKPGSEKRRTIWEREGRKCYWCFTPLRFIDATCDHLIPRSEGGGHELQNLVCACRVCNGGRGNLDVVEWVKRIGRNAPVVIERVTTVERVTIGPAEPEAKPNKKKKAKHGRIPKRAGLYFAGKGVMTPAQKRQLMSERGLTFVE